MDVSQVWVTVSSVLLAFVFVFGNNVRQLYESVFLLFVVHPFDVGDCLLVGEAWHTVRLPCCCCAASRCLCKLLQPCLCMNGCFLRL